MKKFNRFIDSAALLEVPLSNGRFTWSREGLNVSRSLIDRFFIFKDWDDMFENTMVTRQPRFFSYHFPLLLEAGTIAWGPSPFRFYNSWLLNKKVGRIIERALEGCENQGWADLSLAPN